MLQILINILLGALPEIIFFSLYLIFIKQLKTKKIVLSIMIFINYMVFIILKRYVVINYIIFSACTYIILKVLYKDQTKVIDIFVFSVAFIYVSLISWLCYFIIPDYLVAFIINRIVLFIPLVFRKQLQKMYEFYRCLWERNDEIRKPIKSITTRNISLFAINLFIFFANIVCLYIQPI